MELIERIEKFNKGRIPEMMELKYKNMSESLFCFYRGTCHLFYEDLVKETNFPHSPNAWICGDLHLENFGSFKSDNRLVYFDLNDFDEAVIAPAAWEIVRLATSIFIGFESLDIESEKSGKMAALLLKTYATTLANGKPNYIEPKTAKGIVKELLLDAKDQTTKDILVKRTLKKGGGLKISLDHPKHLKLDKEFKKELSSHMEDWLQNDGNSPYNYKILDTAFRIAGTGSLGLKRYFFLMKSLNDEGEKFMLIDMKQAVNSSLLPFTTAAQPQWECDAVRIKQIQERMQNRPPALLSTTEFKGDHYIVQEMQPEKDNINFNALKERYRDMCGVIHDMGMLTASAQLRSSGREGSATADELIAFGKNADWIEPVINYAKRYALVAKKDYQSFLRERKQIEQFEIPKAQMASFS